MKEMLGASLLTFQEVGAGARVEPRVFLYTVHLDARRGPQVGCEDKERWDMDCG